MIRQLAAAGSAAAVLGGLDLAHADPGDAATGSSPSAELPDARQAHDLRDPSPEVQAYFGPLQVGTVIDGGVRIEAVHAVRGGAIPVVLSSGGEHFAVEVFRRDPEGPSPVASTRAADVFLSNRGDGARSSVELHGLGAMALGRALARREEEGAPLPGLLTHGERARRHPTGIFHIPTTR